MTAQHTISPPIVEAAEPLATISLRDVTQTIGGTEILRGVNLQVRPGEIYGLLGPNGAGKSTTVDLIAGLAHPSGGCVTVLDVDPEADRARITRAVGVQPQSAALFPTLSVQETLELFASFHANPLPLDELRARTGIDEVHATRVKHLSGGETRRLLIAIALVGRPELVILDEPSAGLDPGIRRQIAELIRGIRDAGATVLMTTHHLDEAASLCDRVAIMRRGRIVLEGAPDELTRTLAVGSEVSFTVNRPIDAEMEELLGTVLGDAGASKAHERIAVPGGTRITARTADPDALLRRITFTRGLHATGISTRSQTLEDLYLAAVAE